MAKRTRIDVLMVERGLAPTREKAQALLMAGSVTVDGRAVSKPGTAVAAEAGVDVRAPLQYVGRGGDKMAGALDALRGSTRRGPSCWTSGRRRAGSRTACCSVGPRAVYDIDVGRGQLAHKLLIDPRVDSYEGVNARHDFPLPEPVDMAVADVSFISLRLVLPQMAAHLRPGGRMLVLVKPQFEAERGAVGRGGIVRDGKTHATVLGDFVQWAIGQGHRLRGVTPSPITGTEGNREFFVLLEAGESPAEADAD
ncbi:Putative rRNA methyltransferase YqxC [Geodia barretti]|uniref:rRNA methyltransferase YqxC n=1 Tax=Geodia barretti TaxID=519541 RepID=A0AA35TDY4_GEOBA|nr:Putative rRNA methyltransferase YqxC [Geodia barretti]